MHWHWDGHHLGWMVLWWLFVLAVIAAVIWVVVVLVRRYSAKETPEQHLKSRYARGEIDRDTYEKMLNDLRR